MLSVSFNLGWLKLCGNWEPQNELEDETSAVGGSAGRERVLATSRESSAQPGPQPPWASSAPEQAVSCLIQFGLGFLSLTMSINANFSKQRRIAL